MFTLTLDKQLLNNIRSRRTSKDIVAKRYELYKYLKDCGMSYSAIGRLLNRSHASIMNLLRKDRQWLKTNYTS